MHEDGAEQLTGETRAHMYVCPCTLWTRYTVPYRVSPGCTYIICARCCRVNERRHIPSTAALTLFQSAACLRRWNSGSTCSIAKNIASSGHGASVSTPSSSPAWDAVSSIFWGEGATTVYELRVGRGALWGVDGTDKARETSLGDGHVENRSE